MTIPELFYGHVSKRPDDPALYSPKGKSYGSPDDKEAWDILTWKQYGKAAEDVGKALIKLGVEPKASTNIIGWNSAQWCIATIGTFLAGGSPTGIYTTSGPEMCQYIANHCDAQCVFVENETHLKKFLAVADQLPKVKAFVCFGKVTEKSDKIFDWKTFLKLGKDVPKEELNARTKSITPKDLATLIYTSGTTGMPKGVQLTHENLTWTCQAVALMANVTTEERLLSYLPLSHIAEQMLTLWAPCFVGYKVFFARPDLLTSETGLTDALQAIRPTLFLGVPRVWEKIAAKIKQKGAEAGKVAQMISNLGKKSNSKATIRYQKDKTEWKSGVFGKIVKNKVSDTLGLDQAKMLFTAAAPISKATLEYFASLGLIIYEIYGMSECSGPATLGYPGADKNGAKNFKLGTAGKVIPGTEVKLAKKTNEILMRGPHVFAGYLKNPEATAEALDADGWLHSGDVGEFDGPDRKSVV